MLAIPQVRRLVLGLVAEFQDRLIREGRLNRSMSIVAASSGLEPHAIDALAVDEATLGLDSLATIELVTHLNVFLGLDKTGVEDYLLVRRTLGDWVELVDHHFSRLGPDVSITFETSGSTGHPKRVRQSREALESEIAGLLDGPLRDSAVTRVMCSVPVTHIYGFLWALLLPMRLGVEAIDLPTGLPSAMLRQARPGDLVIATPFSWDRTPSCGGRFEPRVTGVTSGGPTTETTWRAGKSSGLSRMIEIYGSSETGGVGWRDAQDRPFHTMPDLALQNPAVPEVVRRGSGVLDLQDRLEWVGDRGFHVIGRRDPVVQVAGTNVNLFELRALIEAEPDVQEAAVRLDGDRLKAFIVQSENAAADIEQRLRSKLSRLPPPARPDRFSFGSALPRTATGKPADW